METQRQKRVSRLIQKDLSAIFIQESKSKYRGIMISITHVMVSKDFSVAKIYISLFPNDTKDLIFDEIKQSSKYYKHKLSLILKNQMRKTPKLLFYLDNSLNHYEKIDKILGDI